MVVEESIHGIFYESNDSRQGRENVDDDVGLDFSMGRLQMKRGFIKKKRRLIQRMRSNHLWPFFYLLNLSKENQVKDFQESRNISQIIHKMKL